MKNTEFRFGDAVAFSIQNTIRTGHIIMIDGPLDFNSEPSYDIFVSEEPDHPSGVLYKHIPQSRLHVLK